MNDKLKCDKVDTLLEKLLDGELAARDEQWVKEELANCEACRHKLESLQKMRALLREVYVTEAKSANLDSLYSGVMKKIAASKPTISQRVADWLDRYRLRIASPVAPLGVAATVVVAILAGVLIYAASNQRQSGPSDKKVQAPVAENLPGPGDKQPALADKVEKGPAELVHKPRRPRHDERPYKKNECYITYYNVDAGTVIIEIDPEGDEPAVVWHFSEEMMDPTGEDNRI